MLYFRWKQAFEAGLLNFWLKNDFLSPLFTIRFHYQGTALYHDLSLEEEVLPFLLLLFMFSVSLAAFILEILFYWLNHYNTTHKVTSNRRHTEKFHIVNLSLQNH